MAASRRRLHFVAASIPEAQHALAELGRVIIPVSDQDRALDFYTEKLGFTIITDQPFDDKQRWIELRMQRRAQA